MFCPPLLRRLRKVKAEKRLCWKTTAKVEGNASGFHPGWSRAEQPGQKDNRAALNQCTSQGAVAFICLFFLYILFINVLIYCLSSQLGFSVFSGLVLTFHRKKKMKNAP